MSNNFDSLRLPLIFESKMEQVLKTVLPLEVAKYNTTAQKGYELPAYINILVGSPLEEGSTWLAEGKPFVNVTNIGDKFVPSSIIGCRDEESDYAIVCYIPDGARATRTSFPQVRVLARLVADIIEKYVVDSPGDDNGICSRIDWLASKAGLSGKTGAGCELTIKAWLRSHSEWQPVRALPYFSQISTIMPPVFEQNWLNSIGLVLETSPGVSEPSQNAHTLKNLTYTVSSVESISLTYEGKTLDGFYCWFPVQALSEQLISSGSVGTETVSVNLSTWNTNVFSLLTPGQSITLRLVAWNILRAESLMCTVTLTKAA